MSEIILKEESYRIIGASFEVYNQKGFGFTEPIYQECLAIELELNSIPFVAQPKIEIGYKGRILTNYFRPDFLCFDEIVIEIKAVSMLAKEHDSQTLNYRAATRFKLAWLINFGNPNGLERKRIANERPKSGRKLMEGDSTSIRKRRQIASNDPRIVTQFGWPQAKRSA